MIEIPLSYIIITALVLNTGLGIAYTAMLRIHWLAFYKTTNRYPWLQLPAVLFWSIIFVVFITWKMLEPVTQTLLDTHEQDWE